MVREINGLGGSQAPSKVSDQSAGKASENKLDNASKASQESSDAVELSAEARTLQALTDEVKELPDANLERAEQIRLALESGEYQVDDLVVADKLLQAEALFGK